MSDIDDLEQAILAGARRALSPSPVAGARVRLAALAAVSSGAIVDGIDDGVGSNPRRSERLLDWIDAVRNGVSASKVVVAALALAGAGGLGYAIGFEAGRDARPVTPAPALPREPAMATAFESRAEPPTVSNLAPPIAPRAPAAPSARMKVSRLPALQDAARSAEPEPVEPDQELRTLRRVETLLRENNPRFALALLDELDKTAPNGKLIEERDAARVVARCALDSAESARRRARDFEKAHPASVYLPRVNQACSEGKPEQ